MCLRPVRSSAGRRRFGSPHAPSPHNPNVRVACINNANRPERRRPQNALATTHNVAGGRTPRTDVSDDGNECRTPAASCRLTASRPACSSLAIINFSLTKICVLFLFHHTFRALRGSSPSSHSPLRRGRGVKGDDDVAGEHVEKEEGVRLVDDLCPNSPGQLPSIN